MERGLDIGLFHVLHYAVSDDIKQELAAAKAYAEGRGIRIDVKSDAVLKDIRELIDIKLKS